MASPQTKEELTKCIALNLQIALTAWHELYPDDSDAEACSKSLDLVEFELEDLLTRPDSPSPAPAVTEEAEPPTEEAGDDELDRLLSGVLDDEGPTAKHPVKSPQRAEPVSFRQMLIEIARAYPDGFDITTAVRDAKARGFVHSNPRNIVSITASALVRAGILERRDRGTYALSAAFIRRADDEPDAQD